MILATLALPARAQESPYIVTYDHYLEEPGSLEVEYFSTFGTQRSGNDFLAYWTEFEYGAEVVGSATSGRTIQVSLLVEN